jgi:hypothetical protein
VKPYLPYAAAAAAGAILNYLLVRRAVSGARKK